MVSRGTRLFPNDWVATSATLSRNDAQGQQFLSLAGAGLLPAALHLRMCLLYLLLNLSKVTVFSQDRTFK